MLETGDATIFTSAFINELLHCDKKIISSPSQKNKSSNMYKQTNIAIESTDGRYKFSVFINEHLQLLEIFSVGLVYIHEDIGYTIITRYNGDHGQHKNQLTGEKFPGFHIHTLTPAALEAGLKGENHAEQTTKFATLKEAMRVFFTDLHILNYSEFYPELMQTELFN